MNPLFSFALILVLLWKTSITNSVRLKELRVPAYAAVGGEIQLGCRFDLDGDLLYSVKWYKNGREFYRYVPKSKYPASSFSAPGVHVDLTRSASDVVTLIDVERSTEGFYRCEVSGEAPLFATVADESYVTVHVLPEMGPRAKGLQIEYRFGEQVLANCTSAPSYPGAHLKWMINGKPAPNFYLDGPWQRVEDPLDTVETMLQLKFTVKPLHFKNGVMKLMCQATIPPLYKQETTHTITSPDLLPIEPEPVVFPTTEEVFTLPPPIIFKEPESNRQYPDPGPGTSKASITNFVSSIRKCLLLVLPLEIIIL